MQNEKHIVIFSHGFGVAKDDRGLLSGPMGVAEMLQENGIETFLFDYNNVDVVNNTITATPLSIQAQMLSKNISEIREQNPDAIIDIIAHSQGCLIPAMVKPANIRKIIFLAPSLDVNNQRMIDLFKNHPDTKINTEGVSVLGRRDGTITFVPSLYWGEREKTVPIPLYNALAENTEITIIKASDDNVLGDLKIDGLSDKIKFTSLPGDHQFNGESRAGLLEKIKEIIL
ncbi:MAG: alpha/beta hydrolase [Candidatus Paceibacterota bacterium]